METDNFFNIDDYTFLSDAYHGEGGFKNGDYLIKHPREPAEKFTKRKELSYYLNYVAPVVNSHVDPVFRVEAARDWGAETSSSKRRRRRKDNDLFSGFFKDVTTTGAPLPKFMKSAARIAKLQAVAFIVVDNATEQPGNMAAVLKSRAYPYAYIVKPKQVTNYQVNKAGKLISITYTVAADNSGSNGQKTETWTWTETTWKCIGAEGGEKSGEHKLYRVPVVPLFGKDRDPGDMKPQSEFYNMARVNKRIFNLCSEIDELIRNQSFSVFTYPMGNDQDQEDVKKIVTGTENAMGYDGTLSNKPEYTTPDSAPLEQLRQERKDLIAELYRMAELSHVTGVQEKVSGVAKAWDFETTNRTLADFANNCEQAERDIAVLFELWTNSKVNYDVKYSDDFGIVDVTAELDKVGKALDLNIGGTFNKAVKKKAVDVYLNDLPEEEFDAIIEDIEARAQDETYNFNGAQVSSAVDVLVDVAEGRIAPEAAIVMLQAFFGLDENRAKEIVEAQTSVIRKTSRPDVTGDAAA
ncbi:hypothetical protein [Sporomusa sphaeroides]|uniref:hypothetical protein n=1 Tax=Sporomusa sphaeroides TaxID=47679 RepID=UPI00202E8095|nr:hypothetical protein [Sporomusa sphaeroides]MCM0759958.1 hypothetical protein [Sporomusa sphaeroides DSM 2875]HML33844.1 hypothetical protein [Sporomusa sphaeroides]